MAVAFQPEPVGSLEQRLQRLLGAQEMGKVFRVSRRREPDELFQRYPQDSRITDANLRAPSVPSMTVSVTSTR